MNRGATGEEGSEEREAGFLIEDKGKGKGQGIGTRGERERGERRGRDNFTEKKLVSTIFFNDFYRKFFYKII